MSEQESPAAYSNAKLILILDALSTVGLQVDGITWDDDSNLTITGVLNGPD